MARQSEPLGNQAAVAVGERRGEIHVVLEDTGIGGAHDGQSHFIGNGGDGALEEFELDRILRHGGSGMLLEKASSGKGFSPHLACCAAHFSGPQTLYCLIADFVLPHYSPAAGLLGTIYAQCRYRVV
jgi:hypothetical protein